MYNASLYSYTRNKKVIEIISACSLMDESDFFLLSE